MSSSGWVCIDFTHTRGWESRDRSDDELADFSSLVDWCERAGALTSPARKLHRRAGARPDEARRVFGAAIALRESVYRTLRAAGEGRTAKAAHLDGLNAVVRRAASERVLAPAGERYGWTWSDGGDVTLERILWPIALSAAELLAGDLASRLRVCDADDCGWLFIDESRNRSRRWCTMEDCGNREKVRRYRSRVRDSGSRSSG